MFLRFSQMYFKILKTNIQFSKVFFSELFIFAWLILLYAKVATMHSYKITVKLDALSHIEQINI